MDASENGLLIRTADGGRSPRGCAIAVMAKASIPGRTKTRLVPTVTAEEAARLNSAFLSDIADNLADASKRAAIASFMAFGPPGTAPFFERHLPSDIGLIEIWRPDFGACLFHTIRILLDLGYDSACVLNSDSPNLPTARLVEAAAALAAPGDRAVIGPSTDGGYYLLGLKRAHRRMFEEVAWSTDIVARQTHDRAAELGLEVVTLEPWYDVDDAPTLGRLTNELLLDGDCDEAPAGRHRALHTAATLRGLMGERPDLADRLGVSTIMSRPMTGFQRSA